MEIFKRYKRKEVSELREVNAIDIDSFNRFGYILTNQSKDNQLTVSISDSDLKNGSPKLGDMIARNPKNHLDQWLVAEKYFKDNFESIK